MRLLDEGCFMRRRFVGGKFGSGHHVDIPLGGPFFEYTMDHQSDDRRTQGRADKDLLNRHTLSVSGVSYSNITVKLIVYFMSKLGLKSRVSEQDLTQP